MSHLLGSSEGVVKARDVGHDGSLIRFRGVNDICKKKHEFISGAAYLTVPSVTFCIQHFGNVQVFFRDVKRQV